MADNPDHVTRPELAATVRELRLTIIVSALGANALVTYVSPLAAGALAAGIAITWKALPFLLHH